MDDERCHTRIITRSGPVYMVFETIDEIVADGEWLNLMSWTGSELMPPERISLRVDEVVGIQEMSAEGWVWAKHATELHYARQLQELGSSPAEVAADAQKRLVDVLERGGGE